MKLLNKVLCKMGIHICGAWNYDDLAEQESRHCECHGKRQTRGGL